MTIYLDHTIVPSRDKVAGAKRLAELLGVAWAPTAIGPFAPVFVNDGAARVRSIITVRPRALQHLSRALGVLFVFLGVRLAASER